mmetsp:Transcript_21973/g.26776  ORF Transcript_21973/g.26776 Transcript_21973/m.26776 type:complete len:347 (-) Transcript_21973:996-2036(-)
MAHAVLGGCGALGKFMQQALKNRGVPVRVLDVAHRPDRLLEGVDFMKVDIMSDSVEDLKNCLTDVDVVYAMVTPDVQNGKVKDFEKVNVSGIEKVLLAGKEIGVRRFVYTSSIAVTDHLRDSLNQTEDFPLPELDEYQLPYDRSKRIGEDLVMKANSPEMKTVSLRAGGIFSTWNGFTTRSWFDNPGKMTSVGGLATIDYIDAHDFCDGLIAAGALLEKENNSIEGTPLFYTNGNNPERVDPSDLAEYAANKMGWEHKVLPNPLLDILSIVFRSQRTLQELLKNAEELPTPPHLWLQIARHNKTFDNSRAQELLGIKPKYSWQDSVGRIIDEYQALQREKGNVSTA